MKKGLLPITAQKLSGTSFREFNPTDRKGTVLYKPPAENTSAAIRSFLNLALKIAEVKSKKVQQNTQESPNLSTESVPDGGRVARPLNLILCGPPGTGKTYDTPSRAVEIIDGHARDHSEAYPRFQELCRKGRIAFITFHQSYSYEDFVEGIRPVIDRRKAKGTVRYECRAGIFKQMAIRAFSDCLERTEQSRGAKSTAGVSKSKDADKVQGFLRKGADSGWQMRASESCPPYVLIIDEINRGNISKIFGELITLMEDDKRAGQPVALTVTLPYSGDLFSIPPNLYILGTMNTADKSIALVDVALRRRFEFEQLAPDFLVCAEITPDMRKVLENLNERIVLRKDWDHRIGHAYFRGVADEDRFNEVFERKIIPLLQEYFHNDWDSLRFVLGETGEKEEFIHKLPDSDARSARTKWRWYFDGEESRDFDCLEKLRGNYSI